jgi:hypothetical protein
MVEMIFRISLIASLEAKGARELVRKECGNGHLDPE